MGLICTILSLIVQSAKITELGRSTDTTWKDRQLVLNEVRRDECKVNGSEKKPYNLSYSYKWSISP